MRFGCRGTGAAGARERSNGPAVERAGGVAAEGIPARPASAADSRVSGVACSESPVPLPLGSFARSNHVCRRASFGTTVITVRACVALVPVGYQAKRARFHASSHLTVGRHLGAAVRVPGLAELVLVEESRNDLRPRRCAHHRLPRAECLLSAPCIRCSQDEFHTGGMPVRSQMDGTARVQAGELPCGTMATVTHMGPYEGLPNTWAALTDRASKAPGHLGKSTLPIPAARRTNPSGALTSSFLFADPASSRPGRPKSGEVPGRRCASGVVRRGHWPTPSRHF